MSPVIVAWLLLAFVCILAAARTLIEDLREGHAGRSWCLDCADSRECDCIPAQRQAS